MRPSPRITRPLVYVIVIACAIAALQLTKQSSGGNKYEESFQVFGTYGTITLWTAEKEKAERVCQKIISKLHKLNNRISLFKTNSELSHLNEKAGRLAVKCTPELWRILQQSQQAYKQTQGAFDISVGPLMDTWGFYTDRKMYPPENEVAQTVKKIGLDNVTFNKEERSVKFDNNKVYLDLGGIAKGYGLDMAVKTAENAGIKRGMINLGGNIYVFPKPPPDREKYRIGIRNPLDKTKTLNKITVTDKFIATSGNYENKHDLNGKLVHHIINPETGYPVPKVSSTTVVADSGVKSDVYSTAIFIKGWDFARDLCFNNRNISVMRVKKNSKGKFRIQALNWHWPLKKAQQRLEKHSGTEKIEIKP